MPYFDHNATTPLAPVARAAWLKAADDLWHNPSSPTRAGARARLHLETCREKLALVLGGKKEDYLFTSGATEAARALFSHLAATLPPDRPVAINPTEHPCVLEAAGAAFPGRLLLLPLSPEGIVTPDAVASAFAAGAAAVAVMAANNETGVLQPWPEIAALCHQARLPFLCDASQWLGKLPGGGLGNAGWVFASAHKFGGPKGVGFLKIPPEGTDRFTIQPGGTQENGRRGGTEDLPSIAACCAALVEAEQKYVFLESDRLRWREAFERDLLTACPGASVIAASADRLWNTVSFCPSREENTRWVARLDQLGFQVSTGSACATGQPGPSHVLAALRLDPLAARRVIRISSGWETSEADWHALRDAFLATHARFATESPVSPVITP